MKKLSAVRRQRILEKLAKDFSRSWRLSPTSPVPTRVTQVSGKAPPASPPKLSWWGRLKKSWNAPRSEAAKSYERNLSRSVRQVYGPSRLAKKMGFEGQ